jgi:hypothetical protein
MKLELSWSFKTTTEIELTVILTVVSLLLAWFGSDIAKRFEPLIIEFSK